MRWGYSHGLGLTRLCASPSGCGGSRTRLDHLSSSLKTNGSSPDAHPFEFFWYTSWDSIPGADGRPVANLEVSGFGLHGPTVSFRGKITSCLVTRDEPRRRALRPGWPPPGAYAPVRRLPGRFSQPEGQRDDPPWCRPSVSPPSCLGLRQKAKEQILFVNSAFVQERYSRLGFSPNPRICSLTTKALL